MATLLYRLTVVVLLAMLLLVQFQMLQRMPEPSPTLAKLRGAKSPEGRQRIVGRKPLVHVSGDVGVGGFVTVDGTVDISNAPLEVEIVR